MNHLEVLEGAISAWQTSKHPRFAAIAEWATARALVASPRASLPTGAKRADIAAWQRVFDAGDVLDVPRLLAAVGTSRSPLSTERVTALGTRDDPRVVTGLLHLLEAPPFRAGTAQPFFRACASLLAASKDPRVRPALEDLAARYKGIIETSVGDVIAALLARTAAGLEQVKPGPLPEALERKAAEWEALYEEERTAGQRATSTRREARATDEQLLAAVFAAPDDDGPRLVFADALSERGDERGEFIALQLARARGTATPAQRRRERDLAADAKRLAGWGLPLSAAGQVAFGRGFPEHLVLSPTTAKKAVGEEALRTLRRLEGLNGCPVRTAVALLSSPQLRGLRHVGRFTQMLLDAYEGELPWPSISFAAAPPNDVVRRCTGLRELELCSAPDEPLPSLPAVESLSVWCDVEAGLWASMPNLRALTVCEFQDAWEAAGPLAQLEHLTRLDVRNAPPPKLLAGCTITHFTAAFTRDLDLEGVLGALGKLRVFEFSGSFVPGDLRATALAAARARKLERLGLGDVSIERPFTSQGVVEVRPSVAAPEVALEVVASLPAEVGTRLCVVPPEQGPLARFPPPPPEAYLAKLRQVTRLPVEVDWA